MRVVRRLGFVIFVAHVASQGGLGLTPITELTSFADGDVLEVPGRPRVIDTGPHSRTLLNPARGPGRLARRRRARDVRPDHPPRGPTLLSINAGHEQALTVLPGHGAPWRGDVAEAVRRAVMPANPTANSRER